MKSIVTIIDGKGWYNCTIYGTVRLLVLVRSFVPLIVMEFNDNLLVLTMIQWQGTTDYHFSLKAKVYAKRRFRNTFNVYIFKLNHVFKLNIVLVFNYKKLTQLSFNCNN